VLRQIGTKWGLGADPPEPLGNYAYMYVEMSEMGEQTENCVDTMIAIHRTPAGLPCMAK